MPIVVLPNSTKSPTVILSLSAVTARRASPSVRPRSDAVVGVMNTSEFAAPFEIATADPPSDVESENADEFASIT